MKIIKQTGFILTVLVAFSNNIYCQNIGIGTSSPLMKLHVSKADSAVVLLENTQFLSTNVSNALYFKTGNGIYPYTGAVKTIGQSSTTARLGFFTYASGSPNGLLERMSITDNGNIGIGTTAPQSTFHIKQLAG